MKNVTELRSQLIKLYDDVSNDGTPIEKAKVLVSASNSILKTVALEIEHNKLTGNKKDIPFMNS